MTFNLAHVQPVQAPEMMKVHRPQLAHVQQISRGSPRIHAEKRIMRVTAYTSHDFSMNGKGVTANGGHAREGVTIAAPESIPFGTRIYIPALNHEYVVMDRGGAIKGDKLDLYMDSKEKAIQFGVKWLVVYIIEK